MPKSSLRTVFHLLCITSALVPHYHAWVQNKLTSSKLLPTTRSTKNSAAIRTTRRFATPSDSHKKDEDDNPHQKNLSSSDITKKNGSDDIFAEGDNNNSSVEGPLNKRVRLAKAQAEIDRILNHPVDPPFDVETEMKKVISISPPLVAEGSTEYELEEQVSQVEEALYSAVKAQDFVTAAQKQSEISQLHVDDCGLVLQVNSAFYKAFSDKDVAEMERIWLKDRSCICIHPSLKPLSGIRDIMSTWKRMFESSIGSFQRTWIDPCDIQLTVKANTAIVTCEEHVYARRFVRGQKRESELVNKLMATNIFRKVGGRWYMTYHHSSWHADSEAAKMALKRGNTGLARTSTRKHRGLLKDRLSSRSGPSSNNDDNGPTGLENILGLGNAGPILGDESIGKGPGMSKKIILGGSGSLSDMMMNLLNPKDGDDADENGIGSPGAIIHFSRIDGDEEDDDDDEEEEDDGETYDIHDEEGSHDDDYLPDFQSWVKRTRSQRKQRKTKQQSQSTDLRQECIDLLRKLANEGRISPKHKRVLLTDIISCSAQGKSSMVEVAFELLCEGKDPEESEEEFVDQCQVFAQSLSEPQY
ncbi:SnoaL-like domain containing protein [Nitzschia inconspicua]|uniref:SnoaL-like domain containing protein n=1 Tax=Nitzschia inconspicua TaxID=303405 RepID=A0A9K3LRJ5_9STRA|nr:SnoaL-like domain containing protein [Nitzschia inconspicua]